MTTAGGAIRDHAAAVHGSRGIWLLVLAAGSSSRMRGRDKLMEIVDGIPQIVRASRAGIDAGLETIVAIPCSSGTRRAALTGLPVQIVEVVDADEGMGASLRTATAALPPEAEAAMVLPADMPEINAADLAAVAGAFTGEDVIRGASGAVPGHPVLFPRRLIPALTRLSGDRGARDVLHNEEAQLVPLPLTHALTDLDTPEAWAEWRASRGRMGLNPF